MIIYSLHQQETSSLGWSVMVSCRC